MRPGARLSAAIEILADMEARHRPVAEALKDWGLAHRFAGAGDRAAIGNVVYDVLRWRLSSAWAMDEETPRALVLATVGRRWGLGSAGLAALFAGDAHAPAPLTAAEAALVDLTDLAAAPAHVRADVPEWVVPHFERAFGDGWVEEAAALALRPPLDMRVNRLKAEREKVAKALAKFAPHDTLFSQDGLRIAPTGKDARHPNVQVEPAFQKGWFEIQDEGSQLAALMVGAKAGAQILDLCAGGGGKTLALAAAMGNKGQVFATDSDRTRLAPIFDRLKRAGTRNVQVREAGAALDGLAGHMDAVLIDAPCTGTGTWRRRPDAKWRLSEKAIADRAAEQAGLLAAGARYVKPGGRLVYVTCSVLPDENDDRIAAFLADHPAFSTADPRDVVPLALPGEAGGRLLSAGLETPRGFLMTPARTGTDGFFVAVMRRS